VPAVLTEQYRKGLGATVPALAELLPPPLEKLSFSCCGAEGFAATIPAGVGQVVLCGLETHVCVAQTALDLLAEGYAVFLAVDAISSRHAIDREHRRMRKGVVHRGFSRGLPDAPGVRLVSWHCKIVACASNKKSNSTLKTS
jgi:hypothetical protein